MVPRWSSRARSGPPGADAIWPFDPELTQIELGLRRAIKRETRSDGEARLAVDWLQSRALEVEQRGSVVFAARDRGVLESIRAADAAGDRDPLAVREIGSLLGYPSCCSERYLSIDVRDDAGLFSALLPVDAAPAPAESLWLVGALALICHAPCGLMCVPTLLLGRATLGALDKAYPGFAVRWRELAARLHRVDQRGRVFSQGRAQVEIVASELPAVVAAEPGFACARWIADHRG
jgi:hypothetical protein